jgi:hypothetical protein
MTAGQAGEPVCSARTTKRRNSNAATQRIPGGTAKDGQRGWRIVKWRMEQNARYALECDGTPPLCQKQQEPTKKTKKGRSRGTGLSVIEHFLTPVFQSVDVASQTAQSAGPRVAAHVRDFSSRGRRYSGSRTTNCPAARPAPARRGSIAVGTII